jgi:hypothetical protein
LGVSMRLSADARKTFKGRRPRSCGS